MERERLVQVLAETLVESDPPLEETLAKMGMDRGEIEAAHRHSMDAALDELVTRGMDPELAREVRARAEEIRS